MKAFKFFNNSKRPILEYVFTIDNLIHIKQYCTDIANGETDLLYYYPTIGIIEKLYLDGKISRIAINYFPNPISSLERIHMEINVSTRGIFYVFTVRYLNLISINNSAVLYPEINEEL